MGGSTGSTRAFAFPASTVNLLLMNDQTPTLLIQRPQLTDVVESMRKFAYKGKTDLVIRKLVEDICADLEQGDYASECLACYYWVCQNIRYMRDIYNVEFVKEPRQIMATKSGDCDDMATLLASMLLTSGNSCSFVLACFDGSGIPSHVYVEVDTPTGPVPLDPVANRITADMAKRVTSRSIVRVG